jgi:glycine C-acetyltransferase
MYSAIKDQLQHELDEIRSAGLFKTERHIDSPQANHIKAGQIGESSADVLNFCANKYLGLADHPEIIAAAKAAMDDRGFGMASVRFICGTQDLHLALEERVSRFLGTEDTILFSSCFDANGGVFESLFGPEDAVISDALNHASIIDGIRLCKAQRFRYANQDMADLEARLIEATTQENPARRKIIVTDGVFSMDGDTAKLDEMAALCEKYDAMILVDESHASGFIGRTGRGTHEKCGVVGKMDVITTTFGKALGGASGGCVSGRRELVEMCRQRARPYLFSNTIAPVVVEGVLKVMDIVTKSTERRDKLERNAAYWRRGLTEAGFVLKEGDTPIVPVMLFNAKLAQDFSRALYDEGIYAIGFFFPVVPQSQARIRTQISAGHEIHHLDKALAAFTKVGKAFDILGKTKQEIIAKYGM